MTPEFFSQHINQSNKTEWWITLTMERENKRLAADLKLAHSQLAALNGVFTLIPNFRLLLDKYGPLFDFAQSVAPTGSGGGKDVNDEKNVVGGKKDGDKDGEKDVNEKNVVRGEKNGEKDVNEKNVVRGEKNGEKDVTVVPGPITIPPAPLGNMQTIQMPKLPADVNTEHVITGQTMWVETERQVPSFPTLVTQTQQSTTLLMPTLVEYNSQATPFQVPTPLQSIPEVPTPLQSTPVQVPTPVEVSTQPQSTPPTPVQIPTPPSQLTDNQISVLMTNAVIDQSLIALGHLLQNPATVRKAFNQIVELVEPNLPTPKTITAAATATLQFAGSPMGQHLIQKFVTKYTTG